MLTAILTHKRGETAARRRALPLAEVRRRAETAPPPRDFAAALAGPRVALIAEIKRASPSRGALAPALDPIATAAVYQAHGAAAISVLTDERFFGGRLDDLASVAARSTVPVLRKDFVLEEYQVYEARAAGADAVLLIVAALEAGALAGLAALARDLGMECLVEVHAEEELATALAAGARVIGINNRDLATFEVTLATTARLAPLVPADRLLVSESGIRGRPDVEAVARAGADAVLVGETLVKATDPAGVVRQLSSVPRRRR